MMKLWAVLLLGLWCSAGEAFAQSDRAAITGTVTDVTGAILTSASVIATNVNNNFQSLVVTSAAGQFELLNLPAGQYTLRCLKDGFRGYERSDIVLAVSEEAKFDIVLTIGPKTEVIAISGEVPQLQTQTSSISAHLDNAAITELPLNVQGGRNLAAFMFAYEPGVEGNGVTPTDEDFGSHINGSLTNTKEVMIDGTSAVAQIGGYLSESSPPMEAVQEFQVTSAGIAADDGRTGGGVFRYEMKSGANAWHGSGLFYLHNEALDARSFGDVYNEGICLDAAAGNAAQIASCENGFGKPNDRLYDYGGSVGGAIRKDTLFFYAAYERYTFANAGIGALSSTVPTAAFLSGDFSSLLGGALCNGSVGVTLCNGYPGSNPTPIMVENDAGQTVPAQQNMIFDPANGCGASACQFTGNMIPGSRTSKVAQQIVGLYQRYYAPQSATLTNNNALPASNPATWYESNEASLKLDYNLSQKHRVDGSFIYAYIPRLLSDQGGIWAAGAADGGPMANAYDHNTTAPAIRVRDSWTISNTLLNVASVTFNRFRNPSDARSREGNWPAALGLGNFGAGNFPMIKFQGINGTDQTYVNSLPIDETLLGSQFNDFYAANTFIYDDTLAWVRGRHTYKFGAELRAQQFNSHGDSGVPTFIFDPAQTGGPFAGVNTCPNDSSCGGFGFASFLLGEVNQASVSEPDNTYGRRKSLSLFGLDNIRVTSRLTLNLGLRWDFNGRYHERYGHWSNFNTAEINPVTGLPGSLDFASDGGDSFEKKQYYHNFSGNIGGAYQITAKTVAHASFGVFYVPLNLNTYSGIPYAFNPGFVLNNQVLAPFDWDNGYPGQAVNVGKDPNFTRYGMVAISPQMLELGNVQEWSAGVQRETGRDWLVEANFIQNHGYHLESGYVQANQPQLSAYTALVQAGLQYAWVTEPGFQGPGWASVAPFPNVAATYGPLFFVGSPLGNTDYRSLQLSVRKRTKHGLSVQASYDLSASHGDVDDAFEELYYAGPLQDVYNLRQERHTISDFDQTQIVKGFVLYDVPVGRGKRLLGDSDGGLNALVGGWTLTGDFHYATGLPMRIPANVYYPGINNVYSDIVPGCRVHAHYNGQVGGSYFNPACFVNPPNGEFGDAPGYLSELRNPGLAVEDLGVNKHLQLGEHRQLRFYFQVFNVFNRHGFAGPNTQIGTAGFGTVLAQDLNGQPGPRVGQFGARFSF